MNTAFFSIPVFCEVLGWPKISSKFYVRYYETFWPTQYLGHTNKKKYLLFIWNSNLTGHSAFYLATLPWRNSCIFFSLWLWQQSYISPVCSFPPLCLVFSWFAHTVDEVWSIEQVPLASLKISEGLKGGHRRPLGWAREGRGRAGCTHLCWSHWLFEAGSNHTPGRNPLKGNQNSKAELKPQLGIRWIIKEKEKLKREEIQPLLRYGRTYQAADNSAKLMGIINPLAPF